MSLVHKIFNYILDIILSELPSKISDTEHFKCTKLRNASPGMLLTNPIHRLVLFSFFLYYFLVCSICVTLRISYTLTMYFNYTHPTPPDPPQAPTLYSILHS